MPGLIWVSNNIWSSFMEQKAVVLADSNWIEKSVRDLPGSPVRRMGEEWMLVAAGNTGEGAGKWNAMTVSWGSFGLLWHREIACVYIRPNRQTSVYLDANSLFTLSFFNEKYHNALSFFGENSGRNTDKAAETGLTPIVFGDNIAGGRAGGAIAFGEASEIVVCRKIYIHDFDSKCFQAKGDGLPESDDHRMYIGEVLTMLTAG